MVGILFEPALEQLGGIRVMTGCCRVGRGLELLIGRKLVRRIHHVDKDRRHRRGVPR